jgi:hypothetical protein
MGSFYALSANDAYVLSHFPKRHVYHISDNRQCQNNLVICHLIQFLLYHPLQPQLRTALCYGERDPTFHIHTKQLAKLLFLYVLNFSTLKVVSMMMMIAVIAQSVYRLGYGLDDRGSRVRFPAGLGIFLFTIASTKALRPTQSPIQSIAGAPSLG